MNLLDVRFPKTSAFPTPMKQFSISPNPHMTRFQLILPVPDHDVTKNMTGLRSHVEGPQMYQINSQTNSFQNMCDMLKITIDRLARKIDSLQKEHLRIAYFCVHESGLPDFKSHFGRQTVDTRSTSGLPLKTCGYDSSNWECGKSVASKLSAHEP